MCVLGREEKIWDARDFDGSIDDESIPKEYLAYMGGKWYSEWDYYSGNLAEKIEQAEKDILASGAERAEKIKKQKEKESVPKEKRDVRLATPKSIRKKGTEQNIKDILLGLGIHNSALYDEEFYVKVENDPYIPLSIERQGKRLLFTHFVEVGMGDITVDSEMIFEVGEDKKLTLVETAVRGPFNEDIRGKDAGFAKMFSENLVDQGFGAGTIIKRSGTSNLTAQDKHELFLEALKDKAKVVEFEIKTGMDFLQTKKVYDEKTKKNDAPETMEEIFVAFDEATKNVKNMMQGLLGLETTKAIPDSVLEKVSREYFRISAEINDIHRQISQGRTKTDQRNLENHYKQELQKLEREKRNLTSKTQLKKMEEFKDDLDELSNIKKELDEIKGKLKRDVGTRDEFGKISGGGGIGMADADWWRYVLADKEGASDTIDEIEALSEKIEELDYSFFLNYERQIQNYIREHRSEIRGNAEKQSDGTIEEEARDIEPEQEADRGDDRTIEQDLIFSSERRVKNMQILKQGIIADGTNIISADDIKKRFKGYMAGKKDIEYAKEAGVLADKLYQFSVSETQNTSVRLVAGGSGSGKSEVVVPLISDTHGIVFDGTMANYEIAKQRIQLAQKKGKIVEIHPIYVDIDLAIKYSRIREKEIGRHVPEKVIWEKHKMFRESMVKIAERFPDIHFIVRANKVGTLEERVGTGAELLDFMKGLMYSDSDFTENELGNELYRQESEDRREVRENEDENRGPDSGSAGGKISSDPYSEVRGDVGTKEALGIEYEGEDISHIVGDIDSGLNAEAEQSIRAMQEKAKNRVEEKIEEMEEILPPVEVMDEGGFEVVAEHKDMRRRDINFIHNIFGQAHDIYMTNSKEFAPAKDFEKAADQRRMDKDALDEDFAKVLKKYYDLKKEEKKNVNEILVMGDSEGKIYAKAYLEDLGLTEREIIGYYAVRNSFEKAQKILIKKMLEAGAKDDQIEDFKHRMKGYVPHRWQNRFVVKTQAKRKIQDRETGEVFEKFYTDSMEDFKSEKKAKKKYDELVKSADENHEYVLDTLDSLDVDFFQDQELSREKVLGLLENVQSPEEVKSFMEEQIKNMFKEKGFGQHYIRRSNIKGYDKTNMEKHIANYFSGFSGYITKMQAAPKYFESLNAIDPRRQKKFHKYMRDLIAYDMGNTYEFNSIKQVGFLMFLANDISFLAVNTTQNYIMGTAELSKSMKGSEKIIRPEKEILKAQIQWATQNGMNEEEKTVIGEMLHAGRLGGEMTSELTGFHNNPLYRELTGVYKKALFKSTALVEQNVNRVPMFLAARRVLESSEEFSDLPGLREKAKHGRNKKTREEAQELLEERTRDLNYQAFQIEENVHFRYGKQHRSRFQRGIGGVSFLFMHYIRSFLWAMARDAKGREFASLARKMMYTFAIGGVVALPLGKAMLGAFEEIMEHFGWWEDDEEREQEKSFWRIAFERGLPAAYGVDLSGRVSIDIFLLSNMMERPEKLNEVTAWFGAAGGLYERGKTAVRLFSQERYWEALGKGAPDFFGNIARGGYGYRFGVFSQYGNPLVDDDGFPVKYSLSEAVIRGLGFTPTREAMLWEKRSEEWEEEDQDKSESSKYRARIRHSLVQGDIVKARIIERDAIEMGDINPENSYIRDWVKERGGIGKVASAEGIVRFMQLSDQHRKWYLDESSERHKDDLEKWLYAMDHVGEVGIEAEDEYYDWYDKKFDKTPSTSTINSQLRKNLEVRLVSEGTTLAQFFYDEAKKAELGDTEIAVQMRSLKKQNKLTMDDIKEYAEISGGNVDNIKKFVEMSDDEIEERFPDLVLP